MSSILNRPISSSAGVKRRRAITDAERKALRAQYNQADHPKPNSNSLIAWFLNQFGRKLSQSTVSVCLSHQYDHLDDSRLIHPQSKKRQPANWEDLEMALYEWQQKQELKHATITGDILKAMAKRFWARMPQYQGVEEPKFSTGWLDGFKKRYKIHRVVRHGEAAAVDQATVELELVNLREELKSYPNEDIYNMDESALYWKMTPDRTLAVSDSAGVKLNKSRITINLCCNVVGHKMDPWFIGTAAKPRCFARSGVKIENLPMTWRHNKKAWMTGKIFKEYLLWFNALTADRNVVLLVDGFSSHHAGLKLLEADETALNNVKVR